MGGSYNNQDRSFNRLGPQGQLGASPTKMPQPDRGPGQWYTGSSSPETLDRRTVFVPQGQQAPGSWYHPLGQAVAQAPQSAPMPQPGVYTPGAGAYDPPPRMQAPMSAPLPQAGVAPQINQLVGGAGQAQQLLQNALAGGGASIADIIARVAQNQRMMQSALQAPAAAGPGYLPRTY